MLQVKRTEHKILINQQERLQTVRRLDAIMPRDANSTSSAGYEVRTLYFDTLDDRACAEKDEGLLVHEKIRARIYGTSDKVIKLECKHKEGSFQVKQSMFIDRPTLEELARGRYECLKQLDDPMALFFYGKLSAGMFPKAIIQYQRLSYCLNVNNIRITFDSDVRATECCTDLFQEPLHAHPILEPDRVILEVKYNNFLLGYIKNALRPLAKSPTSYSKYFSGRTFYRRFI